MKRGRPNKRASIKVAILDLLSKSSVPMTVSALNRMLNEELHIQASWNTTQKYIRELIETNQVKPVSLPHSKKSGETGLVVYMLKD